jgi:hypothetical protein
MSMGHVHGSYTWVMSMGHIHGSCPWVMFVVLAFYSIISGKFPPFH